MALPVASEVIPNGNLKGTRVNLVFDLRSVGLHSVKVVRHPVMVLNMRIYAIWERTYCFENPYLSSKHYLSLHQVVTSSSASM